MLKFRPLVCDEAVWKLALDKKYEEQIISTRQVSDVSLTTYNNINSHFSVICVQIQERTHASFFLSNIRKPKEWRSWHVYDESGTHTPSWLVLDNFVYFRWICEGPRWRSLLRHCATNRKGAGSIPDGVTCVLSLALEPGVDIASDRNEYQEYFLESKGGRFVGLTTLPPSSADCLEIWEPQPPRTLRACAGL
jgi:hypothetical protein